MKHVKIAVGVSFLWYFLFVFFAGVQVTERDFSLIVCPADKIPIKENLNIFYRLI